MKTIVSYFEALGYSIKSVKRSIGEIEAYIHWCNKNEIQSEYVQYTDILKYIQYLQEERGLKQITISKYVLSIKHYYRYLIGEHIIEQNPIQHLEIKGVKKQAYHSIFTSEELELLYLNFPLSNQAQNLNSNNKNIDKIHLCSRRNKAMLGFFIFQGVDSATIKKLQIGDVDLRKGIVKLPQTRKSNARTLKLDSVQILELMEYISIIRNELIRQTEKYTGDLFISLGSKPDLQNVLSKLSKKLKKQDRKFTGFNQIRASRITNWIQTENLREAQYRAGHKYLSSTEKYKVHDIESLALVIERFHPLG
ncbi:MAG: tyrosine-type recombinase/integrase [Flavobacteriales bacterium]